MGLGRLCARCNHLQHQWRTHCLPFEAGGADLCTVAHSRLTWCRSGNWERDCQWLGRVRVFNSEHRMGRVALMRECDCEQGCCNDGTEREMRRSAPAWLFGNLTQEPNNHIHLVQPSRAYIDVFVVNCCLRGRPLINAILLNLGSAQPVGANDDDVPSHAQRTATSSRIICLVDWGGNRILAHAQLQLLALHSSTHTPPQLLKRREATPGIVCHHMQSKP